MSLFSDTCDFIERTQIFDDKNGWRTHVLRFDSYYLLHPPYGEVRSSVFIGELVRECANVQWPDNQWAIVVLLDYVRAHVGVNYQQEAVALCRRWEEAEKVTTAQPARGNAAPRDTARHFRTELSNRATESATSEIMSELARFIEELQMSNPRLLDSCEITVSDVQIQQRIFAEAVRAALLGDTPDLKATRTRAVMALMHICEKIERGR